MLLLLNHTTFLKERAPLDRRAFAVRRMIVFHMLREHGFADKALCAIIKRASVWALACVRTSVRILVNPSSLHVRTEEEMFLSLLFQEYLPVAREGAAVAEALVASWILANMWSFAGMGAHMHSQS